MSDTSKPTVDWQKLFGEHGRRLAPLKESRWQKKTPEHDAAKRRALDECAMESAFAQLTLGMESLKPGLVWSRPAVVPQDDAVLIWHLRVSGGRSPARASRDIATDFWRWRNHVLDVEREDGAKVLVLMRAVVSLLDVNDGKGVGLAKTHSDFLMAHYGAAIGATLAPRQLPDDLPREVGTRRSEFHKLCYQLVRREAVLPTWLAWFGSTQLPDGMRPRGPASNEKERSNEREAESEDDGW